MNTAIHNGWRASVASESPRKILPLRRSYPNAIPRERIHLGSHVRRAMAISSSKKANLTASRKQRIQLQSNGEKELTFSEFLKHPSGMEAVINAKALQSYQLVDDDDNTYRCTLPTIQLMSFEVSPVLVLRVIPTQEDCTVELLSCKLEGSELLENQSEMFSAIMTNCMTWNMEDPEPFLEVDVSLKVTLEISTRPFTMLPVSAVEAPGNLVMQTLVDTLVPLLLQQLLKDYDEWIQKQQQKFLN
ncbi:hypothetical protein HID58_013025 [Brassica napus]|uniref:BnaA03g51280D protein n=2 Tax=Brassica napus TaxID=3708 RepID=A0A078FG49_BRANA|nr:uncharacterized protein BNAA03G51280D [Brassica napus]KAH0935908.1 hypothetical protein HID58_013025 [Brassica napus]CAF2132472.1 unnamed protein product [Brassica napus]CDY13410.1 BnaA03g51280D [Brassica napus]